MVHTKKKIKKEFNSTKWDKELEKVDRKFIAWHKKAETPDVSSDLYKEFFSLLSKREDLSQNQRSCRSKNPDYYCEKCDCWKSKKQGLK